MVTPTLVKEFPLPLRRIVGDLSNREMVLFGLDVLAFKPKVKKIQAEKFQRIEGMVMVEKEEKTREEEKRKMKIKDTDKGLEKIATGISGFDKIAYGGIPKGRTTLLSGTSGSGKTVFSIIGLIPPSIKYGKIKHPVQNNLLSAGSARFKWPPRGVQPHINSLNKMARNIVVIILNKYNPS